jgi:hypothetical protein
MADIDDSGDDDTLGLLSFSMKLHAMLRVAKGNEVEVQQFKKVHLTRVKKRKEVVTCSFAYCAAVLAVV